MFFEKGDAMVQRLIASRWRGVYSYDKTPNLPSSCVDTEFDMRLKLGWFGRFTGSIEDSAHGIPEPATIRGRLSRAHISFSKSYVSFWVDDLSGEFKAIPGEKSYLIHYAGKFIEQRNRIVGNWEIRAERRWIDGEEWEFPGNSGTWTAEAT